MDNNAVVNALISRSEFESGDTEPGIRCAEQDAFRSARESITRSTTRIRWSARTVSTNNAVNQGIGGHVAVCRGHTQTSNTDHEIRLTETMIINPKTINETRFEYNFDETRADRRQFDPDDQVSRRIYRRRFADRHKLQPCKFLELQNYTTTCLVPVRSIGEVRPEASGNQHHRPVRE